MPDSANSTSTGLVIDAIRQVLKRGSLATLATIIESSQLVGAKLLVEPSRPVVGELGDANLNAAVARFAQQFLETRDEAHTFVVSAFAPELVDHATTRILFERIQPEPRVVICGAGHVGAALAKLASFTGYRGTLIDDRADFVVRDRFPDESIGLMHAATWATSVQEAIGDGHGVSVAIVTRGHSEDEECLRVVLQTNAEYIGLIGSKRRTNIVLDRLRSGGVEEEKLARVRAPIGLDIGAVTPEEVALAILAEIVAERRGGKGKSLSEWRRNPSPKTKVRRPKAKNQSPTSRDEADD